MKYYVQFLEPNKDYTKMIEPCGSDSVYILDGRNSIQTMKRDAIERMDKLRHVQSYSGYRIMKGSRFDNSTVIYEWVRSGCLTQHHNRHELDGILTTK